MSQFKNNILYLSAFNTPEAGNRVLLAWIKWLLEHDCKVALACPGGGWISKAIGKCPALPLLQCDFSVPGPGLPQLVLVVLRLAMFIKRHNIQIIHCNSEIAYRYGMYASRICGIPIVTHFRFHFPEEYYEWSFKGKRCPSGVFFVSRSFYEEELPKLKHVAPAADSWVLYNCIDPKDYLYNENHPGLESSSFVVVYPAAIQELKNQLDLFRIQELLAQRGIDVEFICAGRVKEADYWEKCKQRAKGNDKVRFIGHVDDVRTLYGKADLSISLSTYETFGFSVLESMASGVPVVSYAVPALEEVIGDSGFTVPAGDVEAIADVIALLSYDEALRAKMSKAAKARAAKLFSPDVIVPQLLECYAKKTRPLQQTLGD